MKIAAIGDFHIPNRSKEIPKEIYRKLKSEKPNIILCTGDTNREILKKLKEIAETKTVKGNMDRVPYPEKIKEEIKNVHILVIHGNQVVPRGNKDQLRYLAEEENADILITGHTHQIETDKIKNTLIINPGSATGAWSGGGINPEPSFITIQIKEKEIKLKKIYENREEEEEYELDRNQR